MNILHIMKDYKPNLGGSVVRNESMLVSYSKLFEDNLYLINLDGKKYHYNSIEQGIKVTRCSSLIKMIGRAIMLTMREKIDVIHTHNFRFLFVGYICHFLRPHTKLVVEMHAIYEVGKFKQMLANFLLAKTDAVIVLSNSAKEYLITDMKIKADKIHVVRNGLSSIDEEKKACELTDELEKKRNKYVVVGYSGSFIEWQGVKFLADNFDYILERCRNIILLMIGNGPDYQYVADLARSSKYSDRIIVHEGIPKAEMYSLMRSIDIVLIPREKNLCTNTAIPLKAVEAMQLKKCILSADDLGLTEVLNEKNARIFKSKNIDSFIEILQELLNDEELRSRLGEKAGNDVYDKFSSWEKNAILINEVYKLL